jgi:GTP cyclohydrolase I
MDETKLQVAIAMILEAIGEDPTRPELASTPERAAGMFTELFGGLSMNPRSFLEDTLPEEHQELIVLRNITVRSMCEHHLVPMIGVAHIGYIPNGRIVGFDRLTKVADAFARRPQLQERLTRQIADTIDEMLQPAGVTVVLEMEQTCMTIRGARQANSRVITTANRGVYRDDSGLRTEFQALIQ